MKTRRTILSILIILALTISFGCVKNNTQTTELKNPESVAQMTAAEKELAMMTEELDGFCDELGAFGEKIRSEGNMMKYNEQLMELRKGAWEARNAIISGDIDGGREQITVLVSQLESLKK